MSNHSTESKQASVEHALEGYRDLVRLLAAGRTPEFPDPGVTMAQMRVLMLLSAVGEERMSDLAQQLGISLSTLSSLVDRLVDGGLAERRSDAHDRRSVLISLAPAGLALLETFQELGLDHLRGLLEQLGDDEVATVTQAINHLVAAARRIVPEVSR